MKRNRYGSWKHSQHYLDFWLVCLHLAPELVKLLRYNHVIHHCLYWRRLDDSWTGRSGRRLRLVGQPLLSNDSIRQWWCIQCYRAVLIHLSRSRESSQPFQFLRSQYVKPNYYSIIKILNTSHLLLSSILSMYKSFIEVQFPALSYIMGFSSIFSIYLSVFSSL